MRQRSTVVLALILSFSASGSMLSAAPVPKPIKQGGNDAQFGQHQEPPRPDPDLEKKMVKARQKERYENLKRDSEKLLELATELKQQVDKSGENILSMNVVKKCDEIEKLARSVRGKMKGE